MRVGFFHTAQSNEVLFSAALARQDVAPARHVVRADLLSDVTAQGGLDDVLSERVADAMRQACLDVDLLLCSCSSLGPVADLLRSDGLSIDRTDRLLAKKAVEVGEAGEAGTLKVLVAAPTTLDPTRILFEETRATMGAPCIGIDVVLIPDAWVHFLAGRMDLYHASLAEAIDWHLRTSGAGDVVVLGQASMFGALGLCRVPSAQNVLTVPGVTALSLASC